MNEPVAGPSPTSQASAAAIITPAHRVAAAILWACLLAVAGGLIAGLALEKFGMLGSLVFWATGAFGGFVSRKLTQGPNRAAAYALVVACAVAFVVGEASWYRWNFTIPDPVTGEHRDPSWVEAFTRVPKYLWQHRPITMAIGALCTFLGAQSAYRAQTLSRGDGK